MTPEQRQRARGELAVAGSVLSELTALVAQGRERYDAAADRRAHVRYLWIVVESRLKNHSAVLAIPRAPGRFAQAIGLRQKLAYTAPQRVDDELIRRTSEHETPDLAADRGHDRCPANRCPTEKRGGWATGDQGRAV